MSTPTVPPFHLLNREKPPSAKYKCPVCEQEDFPIMLLNIVVPLKYSVANQMGEIAALRTIVGCGNCRSVISIQFIPVDLPAAGVSSVVIDA